MTQKTALITGASAGLGREFARQLAAAGKDLILVARRTEPMQEIARALESEHGVRANVIRADLSERDAAPQLFENIRERGLQVDDSGCVRPPQGPGLGVTIDESALAAFPLIDGPGYV